LDFGRERVGFEFGREPAPVVAEEDMSAAKSPDLKGEPLLHRRARRRNQRLELGRERAGFEIGL